ETCQIVSLEKRKGDAVADEVDLRVDVFITAVRRHHEEIRAKLETLSADRERWLRHELCFSKLDWLQIRVVNTEWLQSEFRETIRDPRGGFVTTGLRRAATLHVVCSECVDGFFDRREVEAVDKPLLGSGERASRCGHCSLRPAKSG